METTSRKQPNLVACLIEFLEPVTNLKAVDSDTSLYQKLLVLGTICWSCLKRNWGLVSEPQCTSSALYQPLTKFVQAFIFVNGAHNYPKEQRSFPLNIILLET